MRTIVGLMAALAAALATAPAGASPSRDPGANGPALDVPLEGVVTNPDWLRRPTAEEFANYYPRVASTTGIGGHVSLECEVLTSGLVVNCLVRSETPLGMHFGDAAVALAKYFQMKPMTRDGVPVAGGKVLIPVGFLVPDNDDGEPPAAPGPSATPKALEFARQIATAEFGAQPQTQTRLRQTIGEHFASESLTEQEQAALDDYASAFSDVNADQIETAARFYTQFYSEAQLAEIAGFYASPTGQAWAHQPPALQQAFMTVSQHLEAAIQRGAARRFCADHACGGRSPPPASVPPPPPQGATPSPAK
jgi:TonB family protein